MWLYFALGAFIAGLVWWKCAVARWQAQQPWPDFGGDVKDLRSMDEWQMLLAKVAEQPGRLILVDAFAKWCPPCRKAAPAFAQLSEEYPEYVTFAKVDVDVTPALSKELGVSPPSLPRMHVSSLSPCGVR